MTPEAFKALYGKALAGEETWADAAKTAKDSSPTKAGASTGNKAASQARQARAQAVAQPAQSQADTASNTAPPPKAAVPPAEPAMPPQAKPDYQADLDAPAPREPIYSKVKEADLINRGARAVMAAPGAVIAPFAAAGKGIGDLWAGAGRAAIDEAKFQAQPLMEDLGAAGDEAAFQARPALDDAEAYRQKLLAMMGRAPAPSNRR